MIIIIIIIIIKCARTFNKFYPILMFLGRNENDWADAFQKFQKQTAGNSLAHTGPDRVRQPVSVNYAELWVNESPERCISPQPP